MRGVFVNRDYLVPAEVASEMHARRAESRGQICTPRQIGKAVAYHPPLGDLALGMCPGIMAWWLGISLCTISATHLQTHTRS